MRNELNEVEKKEALKKVKKKLDKFLDKDFDISLKRKEELRDIIRYLDIEKFNDLAELVGKVENQDICEHCISKEMISTVYGWNAGNFMAQLSTFLMNIDQDFVEEYEDIVIGYQIDGGADVCKDCVTEPELGNTKKWLTLFDIENLLDEKNESVSCERCKKSIM